MKKSDRTYSALIQMALVILYPVLFNLCALIGSADQNRPDSIIKLAGLLVPTGLFIFHAIGINTSRCKEMIYFTSDLHFWHEKIIHHCSRRWDCGDMT